MAWGRWGSGESCLGYVLLLLSIERHVMYTAAIVRPESDWEIEPYDRTAWNAPASRTEVDTADGPPNPWAAAGYTSLGRFVDLGESGRGWGESGCWFSVRGAARADPAPGLAIHGGWHLLAHPHSWGSASLDLG